MIKIPKDMIFSKIKEKSGLTDAQISTKVKDKLDQLSGLISEEGALHIIANELGVKIFDDPGKLEIKNVLAGMRNVELTGKVVKIYEVREFNKNDRKGKVGNFLIGDQTGVMRIVAWNDKANLLSKLKEGDIIKIESGYSRDNRGRVEVHMGDKTKVTIDPKGVKDIEVKPYTRERKQIKDLTENEENVEIMGTIVQVFDPRFFAVDPETGKRVTEKEGSFYLNDQLVQNPTYSYVTNLFVDDGTENVRVVLWRNQTQKLFEKSHEEILSNKDAPFEDIKNELLGKIVKFVGRTNKNEMFDRIEFIPNLVFTDPDPNEEIEKLSKDLEEKEKEEEATAKILENESIVDESDVDVVEETIEIPKEKVAEAEIKQTEEQPEPVEIKQEVEEPVMVNQPVKSEIVEKVELQPEIVDKKEEPVVQPVKTDSVEQIEKPVETKPEPKLDDDGLIDIDEIEDISDLDSI